ncbi:hypothetical protein PC116_g28317 [Phytophthora cactorum]|uniref:Uncharacterized protein n=1 Tax=Phytophthora cactorum TaxID=29920 RepID=A0A8T1AFE9_9STRA|nr:hypothetical protein PC114_g26562 [Phytophthora cactorum]KAG2881185.1 hypothetical protein PC117_g26433 [Phytophthora cactorum]KAG2960934.1 hypothetical protein PC119_g26254 [Phytophthora cactorum]KAG3126150.1 hypothetical protein C6341_g25493 [Phytophthora cactorum]KAG3137327.1 hypothetical protein PC128_g25760 [Phytophthora cactorum]
MVKLFCAIDGVAESAFPVNIDAGQLVGDLKDAIKAKNSATTPKTCSSSWRRRRKAPAHG